jgi:hypothetical protein
MGFTSLFLYRVFPDFNFSETWDPDLKPGGGPSQLKLIQVIHAARCGERGAAAGFTETRYWTLRPESFECFQRVHGPRSLRARLVLAAAEGLPDQKIAIGFHVTANTVGK